MSSHVDTDMLQAPCPLLCLPVWVMADNLVNSSHKHSLSVSYVFNTVLGAGAVEINKVKCLPSWNLCFKGACIQKAHAEVTLIECCVSFQPKIVSLHTHLLKGKQGEHLKRWWRRFRWRLPLQTCERKSPTHSPRSLWLMNSSRMLTSEFTNCFGLHHLLWFSQHHLQIDKLKQLSPFDSMGNWGSERERNKLKFKQLRDEPGWCLDAQPSVLSALSSWPLTYFHEDVICVCE